MNNQKGMTIVEMVIATTIASITLTILAQFIGHRLNDYQRNETQTILQQNTKLAVETVGREIRFARTVENVNALDDINPPCSASSPYCWSSTQNRLVLAVPSRDTSGNLIYRDTFLHGSYYTDNHVYYLDAGNVLWRRTLANTTAPGNAAITSCYPQDVPARCSRSDTKVVEDIASLILEYYDSNNVVITNAPDYQTASSIQMTLQQSRAKGGRTYRSSFTSRAAMRND
jgi:prepilin-type N-terminal cleavage/methylation domain-containing protein